ncbi:hypothetical protein BZG36_01129 [Bifiguratus adelaidae]|uniref:Mannosyl-oligosaccharide glucosidase n=1 Tax=Bifiguratus adelaidae TaxID=1938954 RepID=A0A261Y635_9FUNG|nr:hypothetical protein BZG36_01129 [Bifiguratus adelaidae]
MTGLLWFNSASPEGMRTIRHSCEQGDNLAGYGYNKHDGREYAEQTIHDDANNLVITTQFVKIPGGEHGGHWIARIRGRASNSELPMATTSAMFYIGLEGLGDLQLTSKKDSKGISSDVHLKGSTPDLGSFEAHIMAGTNSARPSNGLGVDLSKTHYWITRIQDGMLWRAKEAILENIIREANQKAAKYGHEASLQNLPALFTLSDKADSNGDPNLFVFQLQFQGEFEFDVVFDSNSSQERAPIDRAAILELIDERRSAYDQRFDRIFELENKNFSPAEIDFGRYMLSNLLGGIGYFYGSSIVQTTAQGVISDEDDEDFRDELDALVSQDSAPALTEPQELFTATPSRPFFPRGFYWDEGFHQLLIGKWDNDLSLDIIESWISLIDNNGWVAREQILGDEARSKVPEEFQTQFPEYANPPTLLLAIQAFVNRLDKVLEGVDSGVHMAHDPRLPGGQQIHFSGVNQTASSPTRDADRNAYLLDQTLAKNYLLRIYPKLRLNWNWFRKTQRGELKEWGRRAKSREAYRWRGRTPDHCLTSGLDDYPRANPPHIGELHVDLLSWMGFATKLLGNIASKLGDPFEEDVEEYAEVELNILRNLDDLHWIDQQKAYCDLTVDEETMNSVPVCHQGYLSIFPMTLGLLPADSPKLGAIFDMIEDPERMWSPYGLRSLSKSDPLYRTGEIYWRGPVWMNINYLALRSLHLNYMHTPGPYQKQAQRIYKNLRRNIIDNVYRVYERTGFVWEQYSDIDGEGLRSHPFTGWTSLVLLMMAEEY